MKLYDKAFATEGVLIIASGEALETYFAKNEFDYTFPKGILPLLLTKGIAAFITEETIDELIIEDEKAELEKALASGQWERMQEDLYLKIQPNDKVLVLSHTAFTQIGNWHQGDYTQYRFLDKQGQVEQLLEGEYQLECVRKKEHGKCVLLLSLTKLKDDNENRHNPFVIPTIQAWYK